MLGLGLAHLLIAGKDTRRVGVSRCAVPSGL